MTMPVRVAVSDIAAWEVVLTASGGYVRLGANATHGRDERCVVLRVNQERGSALSPMPRLAACAMLART
jgi:hypothetical protein